MVVDAATGVAELGVKSVYYVGKAGVKGAAAVGKAVVPGGDDEDEGGQDGKNGDEK